MSAPPQQYVYRWGKWRPELKGKRCVVLKRGAKCTALVRFEDGTIHVIDRKALKKASGSAVPE